MANAWDRLWLLVWKNWMLQRRHKIQTVLELLLPLVFAVMLIVLQATVKVSSVTSKSIYRPLSVDAVPYGLTHDTLQGKTPVQILQTIKDRFPDGVPPEVSDLLTQFGVGSVDIDTAILLMGASQEDIVLNVGYYPVTNLTTRVMKAVEKHLDPKIKSHGFETERDMVDWLMESTLLDVFLGKRIAGVVFYEGPNAMNFTHDIRFTIRPHVSGIQASLASVPSKWETGFQFPHIQTSAPRSRSDTGGAPGYFTNGFLALQHAVSVGVIEIISNKTVDIKAWVRNMPYIEYVDDSAFDEILQQWFPRLLVFAFVFPFINTIKNMVVEKEKRLKECMKMMGLSNGIYWLSWFVKAFLMLVITTTLMTGMLMINWKANSMGKAVLDHSSFSVVFVFIILSSMSVIAFSFLLTTLVTKANTGAVIGTVIFIFNYLPFDFMHAFYPQLDLAAKVSTCLLSNSAIGYGGLLIGMWEGTGAGVQWYNINQTLSPDDTFKMVHVWEMLALDTFVYILACWYIEAVFPGEYGIPQPWYFPVTAIYWTGKMKPTEMAPDESAAPDASAFENEPRDKTAGVKVKDLSKVYKNGKLAVNHVSLNMYEGQITALLGHNGAGKTTTISMLVGLFPSSGGTATINGYDLWSQIEKVRSSLGICPQYDVLFDELTVAEHLRFYCLLKGFAGKYQEEVDRMLKIMKLEDKRHAQAQTLSGGMKRKLSVGIALCAGSKVVLLDEPTSGMDPMARRSTWDLLQGEREGRTMLLTTHSMDEADLLGDRIIIMAKGQLQCGGSSLFLKNKYGAGYRLTLVKNPDCDVKAVTDFIKQYIPESKMDQNIGAELSYVLPKEEIGKFEQLFSGIQENQSKLNIASYGASVTTMEEVFLRAGEQSDPEIKAELAKRGAIEKEQDPHANKNADIQENKNAIKNTNVGDNVFEMVEINPEENYKDSSCPRRNTGISLLFQQITAMLMKKILYSCRNFFLTISQLVLPAALVGLCLTLVKFTPEVNDDPLLALTLKPFTNTITPMWFSIDDQLIKRNLFKYARDSEPESRVQSMDIQRYTDPIKYLLDQEQINLAGFNQRYVAAMEWSFSSNGSRSAIAYFNGQLYHTPAMSLALMEETMLKFYSADDRYTLTVGNHPTPIPAESWMLMQLAGIGQGLKVSMFISLSMTLHAAMTMFFLIKERSCKSKHLQFVSGVGALVFWLSHLVWDLVLAMLSAGAVFLVLFLFQQQGYIEEDSRGPVLVIFFAYCFALTTQNYVLAYGFKVPAAGFVFVLIFHIFTGILCLMAYGVLRMPGVLLLDIAEILNWIFLVFPNYALAVSMADIYLNRLGIQTCTSAKGIMASCGFMSSIELINPCCKDTGNCGPSGCIEWNTNFYGLYGLGIGKPMIYMFIEGVMFILVLLLIEFKVLQKIEYWYHTLTGGYQAMLEENDDDEIISAVLDNDVEKEKIRILDKDLDLTKGRDVLVLKDLTKFYDGDFLAVDRLCLGIPKGECFGLLGINGAGKTTSFKMLTGDEMISCGNAFLMNYSIKNDTKQFQKYIGYCPQFDALLEHMTGRETLKMFARLRGIPEREIESVTVQLAAELFLSEHIDKQAGKYSGGNKRKLSTAVALLGNPPVVFLDEPTAGMDPVARRMLWDVICRVRARGQSIILTSHSMEECEALCTRLAIMVDGQFKCLGSPQHLKNKFGLGYTMIVKVKVTDQEKINLALSYRRSSSVALNQTPLERKVTKDRIRRMTIFEEDTDAAAGEPEAGDGRRDSVSRRPSSRASRSFSRPSISMRSGSLRPRFSLARLGSRPSISRQRSYTTNLQPVRDYIDQHFKGSVLKDVHQTYLNYYIPSNEITWGRMFGLMEEAKERFDIEDYSIGQTTLEQVFLNFARGRFMDEDS